MLTNRAVKSLKLISIISSLCLLQSISLTQATEILCPNNCICSSLQDSLSTAQCKQFPYLEQLSPDLRILQIESAEICPISRNLQKFTQLRTLSVSNCAVDVNFNSFKDLPNLQSVTFHNTSIVNIDPSLFEFNRILKYVNLSSNPLKIWRHFLISASVEEVDLSSCGLKEIPKNAFSQILNLKQLILKGNELKTLDIVLPNSINFLDLSHNNFENISLRVFQPLINLNEIDISANPLICSCKLKLIEEYLSYKNVSFIKPVECVDQSKSVMPLNTISLKSVCKLRDNLNERAFVAKLLKRLRRSVDWRKEYIEKSLSFTNEADIIDSLDENTKDSSEIMNVLEAKMKYADTGDDDDETGDNDEKNGNDDSNEKDGNDASDEKDGKDAKDGSDDKEKDSTDEPNKKDDDEESNKKAHNDDDDDKRKTSKEEDDDEKTSKDDDESPQFKDNSDDDNDDDVDDASLLGLNGVLIVVAATIMLLVILVLGLVISLILKFLKEVENGNDSCAAAACAMNACGQNAADDEECQIPMLSRRCSTRKGTTCRICPSTMSSRRSGRTCHCNRGTYSDTDTVVNDCQFDSNLTSACTTFERSSRC